MESEYSIHETSKIYLSPYTIPTGNVSITKDSLKVSIRSLSKEYQIQCKLYSMDYRFNEPVTFTDCYNPQHGYYYRIPKKIYKLKKNYGVTGIVNNANILATINNFPLVDVYKMRFWFLLIAYTYEYRNNDMTINDLLTKCCIEWKKLYDDGIMLNCMLKQSIKNVGHKTVTIGNVSTTEKKILSHQFQVKFSDEEREYILYCINIEEWSYRKSKLAFELRYGKDISLKMIENIVNAHKNKQCLETTAPSGIHMPANLQDNIEVTLNKEKEQSCLETTAPISIQSLDAQEDTVTDWKTEEFDENMSETTAPISIQSLDVVEATFYEKDEWSRLENELSGMITSISI